MLKYNTTFPAKEESLQAFLSFLSEKLKSLKVENKCILRTTLSAEDLFMVLAAHAASEDEEVGVKISSFLGRVTVRMTCRGEAFELNDVRAHLYSDDMDADSKEAIDRLTENLFDDRISLSARHGSNICEITVSVSSTQMLYMTLFALVFGLLFGLLAKTFLPQEAAGFISDNILSVISSMFLNALKLLIGPLVFFSIAASINGFKNIRALGKIALGIIISYLCTSVIAILIGYLTYHIFPIGDTSLQAAVSDSAASMIEQSQSVTVSIKSLIQNIVPTNFVNPFYENDMLQIVFIAVLFGLAVSALSNKLTGCARFLEEGNLLFAKITGMVIKFLPLAIFCSMAKMMIGMDLANVAKVFVCIPVCYLGNLLMIGCYMLLILVVGRLNPLKFIRKYGQVTCIAFCLGSSNATMPYSMEYCGKRLGISDNLYSFSIPLGATINMDGSCVSLMIVSLFLARVFGVTVTGSTLLSLIVSILILSVGAPGVPGVTLICTALLLPQLGVPTEALSIIMGISNLIGLGNCAVNVTGDAAVSTLVARFTKMIDLDTYRS